LLKGRISYRALVCCPVLNTPHDILIFNHLRRTEGGSYGEGGKKERVQSQGFSRQDGGRENDIELPQGSSHFQPGRYRGYGVLRSKRQGEDRRPANVPPWEDLHELSPEELRLTNLVTTEMIAVSSDAAVELISKPARDPFVSSAVAVETNPAPAKSTKSVEAMGRTGGVRECPDQVRHDDAVC